MIEKGRGNAEKANAESTHGVQQRGRLFRLFDQTRCAPLGATSCSPNRCRSGTLREIEGSVFVLAGGRYLGRGFRVVCTNAGWVNAEPYGVTE